MLSKKKEEEKKDISLSYYIIDDWLTEWIVFMVRMVCVAIFFFLPIIRRKSDICKSLMGWSNVFCLCVKLFLVFIYCRQLKIWKCNNHHIQLNGSLIFEDIIWWHPHIKGINLQLNTQTIDIINILERQNSHYSK